MEDWNGLTTNGGGGGAAGMVALGWPGAPTRLGGGVLGLKVGACCDTPESG